MAVTQPHSTTTPPGWHRCTLIETHLFISNKLTTLNQTIDEIRWDYPIAVQSSDLWAMGLDHEQLVHQDEYSNDGCCVLSALFKILTKTLPWGCVPMTKTSRQEKDDLGAATNSGLISRKELSSIYIPRKTHNDHGARKKKHLVAM